MHRVKHIANHLSPSSDQRSSVNPCNGDKNAGLGKKVALIGSGLIGRNWAVLFSRAGYSVQMYDIKQSQLDAAMVDLKQFRVPLMAKYDMLFGSDPDAVFNRISSTTDLGVALKDAVLVQEGVPENIELKQKVFKTVSDTLYRVNGPRCNTIISSSASTIIPSILNQKMTRFTGNLLVSHPVNPPMACPVIEICPSPTTTQDVISRTKSVMESIGMKPCMMKREANGFVVNRLQYALLSAAYQCVKEGIANPSDVDMAVKHGLGLRWSFMGPFETIHLNAPKGVNDYCDRYVDSCIHPVLSKMFKADKEGNDAFPHWTPEVWEKIHQEMEEKVCPADGVGDRCQWRDNRLLNLAVHKREQDRLDQKM